MSGSSGIAPEVYHRERWGKRYDDRMATTVFTPVEEYLQTAYRPDCDYLEGEVRERNGGEFDHSKTQMEIAVWLHSRFPRGRVLPEQRVQVRPNRFRIPDVCVLAEGAPREAIIRTPPMLCVEILSKKRPHERHPRTHKRLLRDGSTHLLGH